MTITELAGKFQVIPKPCVDGTYFQVIEPVKFSFGQAKKGTIVFIGNDKSVRKVIGKEKKEALACL